MFKDKHIHKEVIANQVAGFIFGYLVTTYITIYLVENKIFAMQVIGLVTALIFFTYSYIRMYFIRWLFKLWEFKMSSKMLESREVDDIILEVKVTVRLPKQQYVEMHFESFDDIDLGQLRDSVEGFALANGLLKYNVRNNPWEEKNAK